jgi:carboxylesterase type B
MLGDDDDEGTGFAANAGTADAVISFLMDNYPQLTPADDMRITQLYPLRAPLPNHAPFFPSAAAAYGEGTFTCPSNFIAAQINRVRQPVWNYRFSVVQANDAAAGLGVPHASEVCGLLQLLFERLSLTFAVSFSSLRSSVPPSSRAGAARRLPRPTRRSCPS